MFTGTLCAVSLTMRLVALVPLDDLKCVHGGPFCFQEPHDQSGQSPFEATTVNNSRQ
jgi:hypothetical protein